MTDREKRKKKSIHKVDDLEKFKWKFIITEEKKMIKIIDYESEEEFM